MKDLIAKPTHSTPLVKFLTNGSLLMTGSLHPENANEYFNPLIAWVKDLHAKKVNYEMRIDYINSACAKKLFELLQKLLLNESIDSVYVKWHYQKGDEDILETGQILSESLQEIHFELIESD